MDPDALLDSLHPVKPDHDRIIVVGGAANTLDLLRLSTVRSDDVVLVAPRPNAAIQRFCRHFAVEIRQRHAHDGDLLAASAVIVSIGDADAENGIVRAARRRAIPVHVSNRPLLSDFTLIEMLERRPSSSAQKSDARPTRAEPPGVLRLAASGG